MHGPQIAGQLVPHTFGTVQCIFKKNKIKRSANPGNTKSDMRYPHYNIQPFH